MSTACSTLRRPPSLSRVDALFAAFADPTRLRLLNLLAGAGAGEGAGEGELCVCDLLTVLDEPQAKVSRHLAVLRGAGLVRSRRQGRWIYYRLAPPASDMHARLVECLRGCLAQVPQLRRDRKRLNASGKGLTCC